MKEEIDNTLWCYACTFGIGGHVCGKPQQEEEKVEREFQIPDFFYKYKHTTSLGIYAIDFLNLKHGLIEFEKETRQKTIEEIKELIKEEIFENSPENSTIITNAILKMIIQKIDKLK